jgi:hypothetical protein
MAHSAGGPNGLILAAALAQPGSKTEVLGVGILAGETEYTVEGAPQVPGNIKCFMGTCVGGCCIPGTAVGAFPNPDTVYSPSVTTLVSFKGSTSYC